LVVQQNQDGFTVALLGDINVVLFFDIDNKVDK